MILGCSEKKNTTQSLPFEDEVRPGVANTPQEFSFAEVKISVLIKQGGHF